VSSSDCGETASRSIHATMPCTDQRFPGNCAGLLMQDCMGLAAGYHLLMPEACRTVQYFSPEIKRSRNWDLCEHNYEIMTSIFIENELIRMKLREIIEGWMKGKPARGRRRIQMLHDLASDGGFVALKRAAEDREGWRHRERMSKTCCTAEDYWWWNNQALILKCMLWLY